MSPVIKKKPEKQKIPSKYVLLIYTFVSLALMGLTFSGAINDSVIRNVFGFVVIPFEKGITSINGSVSDFFTERETIAELTAQNALLQATIDDLTAENTLLLQDKYELQRLRDLYELDESYSDYETVGARIVSWGADNWFNTFIIDKGTDDGLAVDMNVIADSGLVGRITQVGPNWARVTSIINDNSNVSAIVLHTGDTMIVSGSLEMIDKGYMSFSQLLDTDGAVLEGDKVVTSYISEKYLPGILIGYVFSVESDSNHITKSGLITPVVDFSSLSEVLVITRQKEELIDYD